MSLPSINMGAGVIGTGYGVYKLACAKNSQERRNAMIATGLGIAAIAIGYYFSEDGYLNLNSGSGIGIENVGCSDMSETVPSSMDTCEVALKRLGQKFNSSTKETNLHKLYSLVKEHEGITCENYLPLKEYFQKPKELWELAKQGTTNIFKTSEDFKLHPEVIIDKMRHYRYYDIFYKKGYDFPFLMNKDIIMPNHLKKSVMWGIDPENRFFVAFKNMCKAEKYTISAIGEKVNAVFQEKAEDFAQFDWGGGYGACDLQTIDPESFLENFQNLLKNGFVEMFPFGNEKFGEMINYTLT